MVRANHIGDWGTQFGMLIAYLEKMANEHASDMELRDLEAFYTQAKRHYDEDEAFAERARNYVVKLQGGDEYCRTMWKKLVDMTMEQNQRNYDRLNVSLTNKDIMGESMYNDMLPEIVADLKARGLAVESEGATVVFLDEFKNKDGEPTELVGEVLGLMRELAEEGRTMLVVTHEMSFARDVSNKVMFLHQGRVEEEGNPKEIFAHPKSERFKQFISSIY